MQPPLGLGLGELDRTRALQLAQRVGRIVVRDFDDIQRRDDTKRPMDTMDAMSAMRRGSGVACRNMMPAPRRAAAESGMAAQA